MMTNEKCVGRALRILNTCQQVWNTGRPPKAGYYVCAIIHEEEIGDSIPQVTVEIPFIETLEWLPECGENGEWERFTDGPFIVLAWMKHSFLHFEVNA